MFDDTECASELETQPLVKKILKDSEKVHSSLDYRTIKAPPMVEYNTIDSYCERKRGESLLVMSGLCCLQSISGPVVFNTPQPLAKVALLSNLNKPYRFFSVEELSLLKGLKNWTNTKVCAVGKSNHNSTTNKFYLNSVAEEGEWRILMDVSLLKHYPDPQKLQQVFGHVEIVDKKPSISVYFVKDLSIAVLPLFVESYKLMQGFIADKPMVGLPLDDLASVVDKNDGAGCAMNDTLDNFSFSHIL